MRKIKLLAPFLMLLSGLIASLMMVFYRYDRTQMLLILILVMAFFYLAGVVIEKQVNRFIQKYEEEEAERKAREGEIIEKQPEEQEESGKEAAPDEDGPQDTTEQ